MTTTSDRLFARSRRDDAARCAASCTACPASTRSAPRPAPPSLGTRSIKTTAKAWALDLAIWMVDLTTLEGADTPGKVRALSAKARRPDPTDPTCPPVAAAVCVYPDMVPTPRRAVARQRREGRRGRHGLPRGRAALAVKLADTRDAVAAGADEIDMVIDRGAFLAGRYRQVYERDRRGQAGLRRGERPPRPPQGDPRDRRARDVRQRPPRVAGSAMLAGADFIKTPPARSRPPRRCPSRWSCSRRSATSAADRRAGRGEAGRRHPHREGRDQVPRAGQRDRGRRLARPRLVPASAPPACSTTC